VPDDGDEHEDGDGCGIYDASYQLSVDYDDANEVSAPTLNPATRSATARSRSG
jgi:hypothetical protein